MITNLPLLAINTIRTLSMDGVQKANSGHPGTPMALAPVTYSIWTEALRYCPSHPDWPGRDRFVLSCGHASMLLYSMLHLADVRRPNGQPAISLDNIKDFRQLGSPCAGHPEHDYAPGIETTTGPLGQGVGNSVGMAIAAKWFAARYNRPDFDLFGYRVWTLCSDGDLMEGISSEAASIAGHLKLDNLCWIYDDNQITIEGETELAFSEDVAQRFVGFGWNVLRVEDANDLTAISKALSGATQAKGRPTLIILKSIIGWGSPNKANTHNAHGAPLGEDEIKLTKQAYGWPDEKFLVPEEVRKHFAEVVGARGEKAHTEWSTAFEKYKAKYVAEAKELTAIWSGELPSGWDADCKPFAADAKGLASRVSSGKIINAIAKHVPWFLGGSADLAPSTMTMLESPDAGHFSAHNYAGRNFHFGIREHGMASAANGMALSGLRPYVATFFVFSDYLRPAMRLSSIMHLPVIYVFTHDSIGLGEDGPTHQPVEHLAACRAIPGLHVVRPGDANEVVECYRAVLNETKHPSAMVLSRQNLPTFDRTKFAPAEGAARGGYTLIDAAEKKTPVAIILATGSEVAIAVAAHEQLSKEGVAVRVVSIPCFSWFDAQDQAYRDSVLPPSVTARVAIEAGIKQGWEKYLGSSGQFVGMTAFGASGPYAALYKHYGLTAENVAAQVKEAIRAGRN
jgi:transketolase